MKQLKLPRSKEWVLSVHVDGTKSDCNEKCFFRSTEKNFIVQPGDLTIGLRPNMNN